MNAIKNTIKFAASLFLISGINHFASATVIDFEGFGAGTIIDDEYVASLGVTIKGYNVARGADNMAVVFDTNNPTGGDSDLGAPFFNNTGLGTLSPGNVLIIHEHPDECDALSCIDPDDEGLRPAGYFDIHFGGTVLLESIDFFDVEAEENGTSSNNRISLFDADDNELSPFYTPNTGGDNRWTRLNFNIEVAYMRIKLHGSGAIDNIQFTQVPEPPTILLLFAGILGLGVFRKLRKA